MSFGRILKLIFAFLLVFGLSGYLYLKYALPRVKVPTGIVIEKTPEKVERGRYLANHVAVCMDCHSTRDWSKYSGPRVEGTNGKGGERFGAEIGFPGNYYSKNITPYGIGSWTDAEVFRAIVSGVNKEGKSLFPIMPYPHYGKADKEDILAIIAYIRTLEPIKHDVPASESKFPMNLLINTMPSKPKFTKRPTEAVAYGEYLTNMASCITCHTPFERGKLKEGMEFAGGREFPMPGFGVVRSVNITPDKETGLGSWTKEAFIKRFKYYRDSSFVLPVVPPNKMNTLMPWTMYAGMTEDDLGAIYEYLQTLKPISNNVLRFSAEQKSEEEKEQEEEKEEHKREKEKH